MRITLALFLLGCGAAIEPSLLERHGFAPAPKQMSCPTISEPRITGRVADPRLPEISAAVVSQTHAGVLWVINDSGNPAELFAITAAGEVRGYYRVRGAQAFDWEGLGYAQRDGKWSLFIADTGDNLHIRNEGIVYEIEEPQTLTLDGSVDVRQKHTLHYPYGRENVEAFAVAPDLSWLFVTRGDGGATVYHKHSQRIDVLAAIQFGDGSRGSDLTTAADADNTRFLLRTYVKAYLWQRLGADTWADTFQRAPCVLPLAQDRQGEAIAFDAGGFYTLSEGVGEPIRHYDWTP